MWLISISSILLCINKFDNRLAEVAALHLCILSHWMMQELLRMPCVTQKSMEDELESIILLRSGHILQHQVSIWEGLLSK